MAVPAAPVLTVVTSNTRVAVCTWLAVLTATGYRLRRRISSDPDANLIIIHDDDADLAFDDFALHLDYTSGSNPLRAWTWNLVAYNDDGESIADTVGATMPGVSDTDIGSTEILHPSYNDGADKAASYSDITKSGANGATDASVNEALIYHEERWTDSI
jgi:hypothetical protein